MSKKSGVSFNDGGQVMYYNDEGYSITLSWWDDGFTSIYFEPFTYKFKSYGLG